MGNEAHAVKGNASFHPTAQAASIATGSNYEWVQMTVLHSVCKQIQRFCSKILQLPCNTAPCALHNTALPCKLNLHHRMLRFVYPKQNSWAGAEFKVFEKQLDVLHITVQIKDILKKLFLKLIPHITAKIQQFHATGENTTHILTTLGQNYLQNHQARRTPTWLQWEAWCYRLASLHTRGLQNMTDKKAQQQLIRNRWWTQL